MGGMKQRVGPRVVGSQPKMAVFFIASSYEALESKFHKSNDYYLKSLVQKFNKNRLNLYSTYVFCKKP